MSEPQSPPGPGEVVFFDAARPGLPAGEYRLDAGTDVAFDGQIHPLVRQQRFDVVAPRFALGPDDVVGSVPPANAEGAFDDLLPQVMLRRRTLPWERALDPGGRIADPPHTSVDPPLPVPPPWMALLVFEESECTILRDVALSEIVPPDVLARLGAPGATRCDAVEARRELLDAIVPTKHELSLLAHVRWVNVEDRDLAGGDDDGWIGVVVGNRLPERGATHWACLVSLEERSDVVVGKLPGLVGPAIDADELVLAAASTRAPSRGLHGVFATEFTVGTPALPSHRRLVLLHAWQFTCGGPGAFADLVAALDVGMLGTPTASGQPTVTDTGHVPTTLHGRAGVIQEVLYRGPLVPVPLTRDPLGPYHSADQARRISPETGAEDIGYASAFELGRLLAASDPRFAEDVLRWRRTAYRRAAQRDSLRAAAELAAPSADMLASLEVAPSSVIGIAALRHVVAGAGPRADVRDVAATRSAVGLDPKALASAWQLDSPQTAQAVLHGELAQPGVIVRAATSAAPADDPVDRRLARITAARDAIVAGAKPTEDR